MVSVVKSFSSTRSRCVHQEKKCTVSQYVYFGLLSASLRENILPSTGNLLQLRGNTVLYVIFVIHH